MLSFYSVVMQFTLQQEHGISTHAYLLLRLVSVEEPARPEAGPHPKGTRTQCPGSLTRAGRWASRKHGGPEGQSLTDRQSQCCASLLGHWGPSSLPASLLLRPRARPQQEAAGGPGSGG